MILTTENRDTTGAATTRTFSRESELLVKMRGGHNPHSGVHSGKPAEEYW